MINIDDSPPRSLGLPGVSIASDFMPLVNSTRSRMLELNVEYRDSMIHLKVDLTLIHQCTEDNEDSSSLLVKLPKHVSCDPFIYIFCIFFQVPDHESISTVKTLLHEKTGVPPCQQELR